jgi:hypothetical protein
MRQSQVDEYKAKAAVEGVGWLVSKLTTDYMCRNFPYPGCYEKAEEIMTKATVDFWVAAAQAGLAAAVR